MATLFDELLKSAEAGNTEAQVKVARMYFEGTGVIKNSLESIKWLYRASDKNIYCAGQIVKMYREGLGVKKDLNKAFEVALDFAKKGNVIQMYDVAGYYYNGVGVEKNTEKAIEWYTKAYDNGLKEAAYILGYIYQTDEYYKDNLKTIEWYKISADNNNPRACYNLGYIYFDGSIVIKDNVKALEYLNKALRLGIKEAQIIIDQINSDGGYHSYQIFV